MSGEFEVYRQYVLDEVIGKLIPQYLREGKLTNVLYLMHIDERLASAVKIPRKLADIRPVEDGDAEVLHWLRTDEFKSFYREPNLRGNVKDLDALLKSAGREFRDYEDTINGHIWKYRIFRHDGSDPALYTERALVGACFAVSSLESQADE